jgi:hypothetical protein
LPLSWATASDGIPPSTHLATSDSSSITANCRTDVFFGHDNLVIVEQVMEQAAC